MTKLYLDIEEINKRPNDMELGSYVRTQYWNKKEKAMKTDYVAEIMQKWYDTMEKANVQVQPKTSTMLGTILAEYDIRGTKSEDQKPTTMESVWTQYMNTKGGDFDDFWSSLSVKEKDYIETRRQAMRDKYYADRGLIDDNKKTLLKG